MGFAVIKGSTPACDVLPLFTVGGVQKSLKSSIDLGAYLFWVISRWAYISMVVRILEWPIDLEKVARLKSGSFL